MIFYIIVIVSILLDGLLTNYLPFLVNDLSLFTPLLTLVSIIIISPFYRKNERKYLITVFAIGFIYDLLYTNLLFFNAVLFFVTALINLKIQKRITMNTINILGEIVILVLIYESLTGIILFTYNMVPVTIYKVFYKITHSLLFNIIYAEVIYWILKIIPTKFKKISIN